MVDAMENLQALLGQEQSKYRVVDYMKRMQSGSSSQSFAQGSKPPSSEQQRDSASTSCPTRKRKDGPDGDCTQVEPSTKRLRSNGSTSAGLEESSSPASPSRPEISRQWREKICEWAFKVIDHFDLRREIVNIAMSHLDRYLSAFPEPVEKSKFQLLSMTCLYLAIKLNEARIIVIPGSKSSMETLLQLSRGFFTLQQVEEMECDVLQRLQWHVHPPTPQLFVRTFLFFISSQNNQENTTIEQEIHGLANFMVELSVMDYCLAKYKSSEIAMAGILNALDEIDGGLQADAHATTNLQDQWILPLVTQDFNMDMSNVDLCRRRLQLIYSENKETFYEEEEEPSSAQGQDPEARTTSPVCVMRAP